MLLEDERRGFYAHQGGARLSGYLVERKTSGALEVRTQSLHAMKSLLDNISIN